VTRRTAALMIVLIGASSVMGCTGKPDPPKAGPQTTTIVVSYDDLLNEKHITRSLTLHVGDTLQVSLGSNPSTGFSWMQEMQITNPAVLTQTGHEVLAPSTDRPGAAASEVWALQVLATGTTTVSNSYGRPWPGGEKGAWTFAADVTVS